MMWFLATTGVARLCALARLPVLIERMHITPV